MFTPSVHSEVVFKFATNKNKLGVGLVSTTLRLEIFKVYFGHFRPFYVIFIDLIKVMIIVT